MVSARKGGPRFGDQLYPHLVVAPNAAAEPRVILVDDVKTSGGHLAAAEARVREIGIKVARAICGARTVYVVGEHPFPEHLLELRAGAYRPDTGERAVRLRPVVLLLGEAAIRDVGHFPPSRSN